MNIIERYKKRSADYLNALLFAKSLKHQSVFVSRQFKTSVSYLTEIYSIKGITAYQIKIFKPWPGFNFLVASNYWIIVKNDIVIFKIFDKKILESIIYFHVRLCLHKPISQNKPDTSTNKPNGTDSKSYS